MSAHKFFARSNLSIYAMTLVARFTLVGCAGELSETNGEAEHQSICREASDGEVRENEFAPRRREVLRGRDCDYPIETVDPSPAEEVHTETGFGSDDIRENDDDALQNQLHEAALRVAEENGITDEDALAPDANADALNSAWAESDLVSGTEFPEYLNSNLRVGDPIPTAASERVGYYFFDGTGQVLGNRTVVADAYHSLKWQENQGSVGDVRYFPGSATADLPAGWFLLDPAVRAANIAYYVATYAACADCASIVRRGVEAMCDDLNSGRVQRIAIMGYSRGAILGQAAAQIADLKCGGANRGNAFIFGALVDPVATSVRGAGSLVHMLGQNIVTGNARIVSFEKDPSKQAIIFNTAEVRTRNPGSVVHRIPVRGELRSVLDGVRSITHVDIGYDVMHEEHGGSWAELGIRSLFGSALIEDLSSRGFAAPNVSTSDLPNVLSVDGIYSDLGLVSNWKRRTGLWANITFQAREWRHQTAGSSRAAGSCGGSHSPERIMSYRAAMSGFYTFSTAEAGTDLDSIVYVRSGNDELACNRDASSNGAKALVFLSAGQEVAVYIDGDDAPGAAKSGRYSLRIGYKSAERDSIRITLKSIDATHAADSFSSDWSDGLEINGMMNLSFASVAAPQDYQFTGGGLLWGYAGNGYACQYGQVCALPASVQRVPNGAIINPNLSRIYSVNSAQKWIRLTATTMEIDPVASADPFYDGNCYNANGRGPTYNQRFGCGQEGFTLSTSELPEVGSTIERSFEVNHPTEGTIRYVLEIKSTIRGIVE